MELEYKLLMTAISLIIVVGAFGWLKRIAEGTASSNHDEIGSRHAI